MANLLTITKEPNDYFTFVLNGDTANAIRNTRNDLLTVGNIAHFKTSQGANLIKEQNVPFGNVTIIDGATSLVPVSVDDLFTKLISVGYFDWINGAGGGGGVNRFDELLDTFNYFGKDGQVPVVDEAQLRLIAKVLPDTSKLDQFPANGILGKILIGNASGGYDLTDPPAGANGYVQAFTYTSPDPQEFTLATTASLISVVINGTLADPLDWSQSGNLLTILPSYTLGTNDRIIATGVI